MAGEHNHLASLTGYADKGSYSHLSNEGNHTHGIINQSQPNAELPYYTLMFIEYTGT